ncbi:glycosyl hydrolase family 95 catalytic domain-containing protein [Caulobacter segnis]
MQGVWNVYQDPPWSSGYWHNVNQQMNYWPAFVGNLPEPLRQLHRLLQGLFARASGPGHPVPAGLSPRGTVGRRRQRLGARQFDAPLEPRAARPPTPASARGPGRPCCSGIATISPATGPCFATSSIRRCAARPIFSRGS